MLINLTVKQAAALQGVGESFIRVGLKAQRLPYGTAVKCKETSERWRYHISAGKLAEYLNITQSQLEEQLQKLGVA